MLWQGQANEVWLCAGVQPRLRPVEGADDLWEASLCIRRLDEAVITIAVAPRRADDGESRRMPDMLVWRGPRAAVAWPAAESLRGTVEDHTRDSAALGAARQVTVYRPPVPPGRLPGSQAGVQPPALSTAGAGTVPVGRGQRASLDGARRAGRCAHCSPSGWIMGKEPTLPDVLSFRASWVLVAAGALNR